MKRLIRIPLGVMVTPVALFVGSIIWLFGEDDSWVEDVGITCWYLTSGQWNKLPD
jgi:hypothetical protein